MTVALAAMLLAGLAGTAVAEQLPTQVITGDPVAPSPGQPGTGLCSASRISTSPSADFPQSNTAFIGGVNAFLETSPNASNPNARVTTVLRTPLDLSNNNTSGLKQSFGDYENAVPGCQTGGCDFFINDSYTPFATRLRGYLNVTAGMVGLPVHFGLYADDAVGLNIYDRNSRIYPVINRPPELGFPTWRTTNSVTFLKPGLYSIEAIYAEVGDHAALEISILVGTFGDFERSANQAPIVKLRDAGFTLLAPASFYQTESGRPSYPDPNQCQQCNRQYANTAGNNGCDSGYYCNGAALCAPCDSAVFCGPSCSPCGASTPLCLNRNGTFTCVQCSDDSQCPNGRCDSTTNECRGCRTDANCPKGEYCGTDNECHECTTDAHCPRGEVCADNSCQPCSTDDSCAGASCNCCPGGLKCGSPAPGASPTCVECTNDSECSDGKRCDLANGRCVEKVAECNTSERCGAQCAKCPTDRPFCLDGQVCVECRSDLECGDGKFCLSGECASCTTDKRCGSRCEACPTEQPFCLTDGTTAGSSCAGCREDADCGPGGTCDPKTRTCSASTCSVTCDEGKVCYGDSCVECFADAHCPCGGTCDTATNICTTSCDESSDCLGVQHCSASTQQCERGRRKPGTEPQGGSFCCGTTAGSTPGGLALLLLVAAFLALRPRRAA
ncbi:outer membrane exchange protein TraA [Archangium sp.]|jgi:outer membrane exchange protein TraA|uniref:outer membrane exchange protein TraA n=1 Tax=Archangium sp. TaxID=1872627 RepID=UPI002EDB709A